MDRHPVLPQTLNRYAYVSNNPINLTDPTGHSQCDIGDDGNMICLPSRPSDDWSDDGGGSSGGDSTPPYDTWEPPLPDDGGDPEPAPTREQTLTQKVLRFLNASGTQEAVREGLSTSLDIIPFVSNGKAAYEAYTGKDLVTDRELDATDRNYAMVSIFLGGEFKVAGKTAIKTGEILYDEGRAAVRTSSRTEKVISEGTGETSIPGQGYHNETYAPKPVKPQDATDKWDEFLGPGEYTNIHPRTGQPDPNRIVSEDGKRSIRYGDHEMNSSPTKHHYHEEMWTYDPVNDVMNVDNSVVRVPNPKR